MPGPVPRAALPCFCLILPGIPGGGYDHLTRFPDEEGEGDTSDVCLARPASWC